ncbi:MAG: hypothetical protein AAGJ35_12630, partial [Myxococcota bacterium]
IQDPNITRMTFRLECEQNPDIQCFLYALPGVPRTPFPRTMPLVKTVCNGQDKHVQRTTPFPSNSS